MIYEPITADALEAAERTHSADDRDVHAMACELRLVRAALAVWINAANARDARAAESAVLALAVSPAPRTLLEILGRPALVVIESPYAGDVDRNLRYLRAALADCLARGEAPYASHGLYTQPGVLDDNVPEERDRGIGAGLAWRRAADATVVYADLGITPGMRAGIADALRRGVPVDYRSLEGWT